MFKGVRARSIGALPIEPRADAIVDSVEGREARTDRTPIEEPDLETVFFCNHMPRSRSFLSDRRRRPQQTLWAVPICGSDHQRLAGPAPGFGLVPPFAGLLLLAP